MPLIQPSLQFQAANPQTVASEVGGTLEHWFDASQSAKLISKASSMSQFEDPSSSSLATRARNYFISKWSLAENVRANY